MALIDELEIVDAHEKRAPREILTRNCAGQQIIQNMAAEPAGLGHKVLQDFGECVYTKHDERHTRFIELQDLNVDQSARSQLNFGPPGTMGSL